jgi:hypothetical protein
MAQQFQSPENYDVGQQVTKSRLNNMVNNAVPLPGLITDRTNLASNTVATGDSVLLNDVSASALVEATASDLLNSNIAITTSSVTAGSGSDITITPNDGTIVTGSSFTSANGLTTVVTTSVAHGLIVGQVVTTSAATQTGYNGTHRITAVTTISPFTFTYVMTTAGTIGSGTISYIKQGVVKNPEHEVINGNLYVDGNSIVGGNSTTTGNLTISGNSTISGTSTVTGTTLQKGNLNSVGSINNVTLDPTTGAIVKTFKVNPSFHYFKQWRDPAIYAITWGGIQNSGNLYGAEITQLSLQFTPKKAGNKIILQWNVSGEVTGSAASSDSVWVVTRTIVSTGVEEPIKLNGVNLSVDASNNTWSGVAAGNYTPSSNYNSQMVVVKIVDESSLDVECIYKLRIRLSQNNSGFFNLNRTGNTFSTLGQETCISLGHAHEICEI